MLLPFAPDAPAPPHDICIVGAGPVGIALALACEDNGLTVLLVESGVERPDPATAALAAPHRYDPQRHASPQVASCRALGGSSLWWGGRCVPYDPIDFQSRPWVENAGWPISQADVELWTADAAAFFGCGQGFVAPPPAPWSSLEDVDFQALERWTPEVNMAIRHRDRLEGSSRISVWLGATVQKLDLSADGRRVRRLIVTSPTGSATPPVTRVVLACGGLETTRLLLDAQRDTPNILGGPGGPLGRFYMGHISGKIADLVLTTPSDVDLHDFFLGEGAFVRRRLTLPAAVQARAKLLNTAFWLDNPRFHDASHRSGMLSLAWLALAFPAIGRRLASEGVRQAHLGPQPRAYGRHLLNVLRSPFGTLIQGFQALGDRLFAKPRRPGFLVRNASGRYALHYHAEQAPNPDSRLSLIEAPHSTDTPALNIDFRYSEKDALSVLVAHDLLDAALRKAGVGHLEHHFDTSGERLGAIMEQATDGFHQIGATRMAKAPDQGVVDANCQAHGVTNLYVAGSSIFPSSGQANPTFLAVALACRLAKHLAETKGLQEIEP